jgi:hypothetical protein
MVVKLSDRGEGGEGEFPRLSDVPEGSEAALHTTQINLAPEAFERFSDTFERAAQRWERIVYPAMFVMVLIMAYGFFLIFNLANDMRTIAEKFDPNMSKHMASLSENMHKMTDSIDRMYLEMRVIAEVMPKMNDKLDALAEMPIIRAEMEVMNKRMEVMNTHMDVMNRQMSTMNNKMFVMTGNIADMNRNVGRPMSFMNSFMPW